MREAVRGRGREAVGQLSLTTVLYLVYRYGRVLVLHHEARAFANARSVWDLERAAHLPSETSLNAFFANSELLAIPANVYYATVHFPFAIATLVWLWVFRAPLYRWTRNVMVGLTGTALLVHIFFPLAPPRMMHDLGFVDLAAVYGESVYGSPETDTLSNQFAAMPSLHIGWALLLALALCFAFRSRWRWLFLAHPLITTVVVVATANHYWLDGIVAVALMVVVIALVRAVSAWQARRRVANGEPASEGLSPGEPVEEPGRQLVTAQR
ncbi:phosphatase PAP2 family protein [Speluncibacter jeojiensis]|uniref:phosphatase PAP2 family protein n=1 Tax=Speluncibacter jeojiensis TaxID=2710754 RepID=UPI0024105D0E|nr:phosphatase PAP2 family protein [Rhodococcus sp. D2-41]